MYKNKVLITVFAAIILMMSFVIYTLLQQPFQEAQGHLQLFLESFHIRKDIDTDSMLLASIKDHTFIKFFRSNPSVGFEIAGTKSISPNRFATSVRFIVPEGYISCTFRTLKTDRGYIITQMPHISCVKCGLPLSLEDRKKTKSIYLFDISGRRYLLESAAGLDLAPFEPVSLLLMDGSILDASPLIPVIPDKVMSHTDDFLETMTGGALHLDRNLHVYELGKEVCNYKPSGRIPPGAEGVALYKDSEGTYLAAVYRHDCLLAGTIRVALSSKGSRSLIHSGIELGCAEGFRLETRVPPLILLEFTPSQKAVLERGVNGIIISCNGKRITTTKNRIYAVPNESNPMLLYGVEKSHANCGGIPYEGTIDVFPTANGLTAVNEISLSSYLCSVVSGEMPVSFGIEPLKAQAVAARTYAVRRILDTGFSHYGANIDDSCYSQIYGGRCMNQLVKDAVKATRGQLLFYKDRVADTRYFSTSCGYTASSSDVWSDKDGSFQGTTVEYLDSKPQYIGKLHSIRSENKFRNFITNPTMEFYDSVSPFFRWKTVIKAVQIEVAIKKTMRDLWITQPQFILTLGSSGEYISMEIPAEPGRLYNIGQVKRGSGGNIIELVLVMSSGSYKIVKELNIRRILRPANAVVLSDGSVRHNLDLLPSTFAVITSEKNSDGAIDSITIEGGGYGHGVGMSQYGAYGMSLTGATYEHILAHYYPGTVLKNIY